MITALLLIYDCDASGEGEEDAEGRGGSVLSFFKTLVVRKSPLLKAWNTKDFNTFRIGENINLLVKHIRKYEDFGSAPVEKLSRIDLEILIARVTAYIENMKSIQFVLSLIAILFVSLTGLFRISLGDSKLLYGFIIVSAVLSLSWGEYTWKNRVTNYTYLKELLIIYKKEKFNE